MADTHIDRLMREQADFIELHAKDADELVFGIHSKELLAAVYFSPREKETRQIRAVFAAVRDADVERVSREDDEVKRG